MTFYSYLLTGRGVCKFLKCIPFLFPTNWVTVFMVTLQWWLSRNHRDPSLLWVISNGHLHLSGPSASPLYGYPLPFRNALSKGSSPFPTYCSFPSFTIIMKTPEGPSLPLLPWFSHPSGQQVSATYLFGVNVIGLSLLSCPSLPRPWIFFIVFCLHPDPGLTPA